VVAFSFIFGESVKNLFQNAIYLFAEHPWDVGDRLKVNGVEWCVCWLHSRVADTHLQ
jgi:small-conductance mechanosensitive channel